MSQPYPLPRETRSTGQMAFNGVDQVYGPFDFKIFDIEDVSVYLKHDGEYAYTKTAAATVTKTSGLDYDTFSVDFGTVHPATSTYVVRGERTPERSIAVTKGGGINTSALEKDLTKLAAEDQELRRDLDKTLRYDVGFTGGVVPRLPEGHIYKADAEGNLVDGGDAGDIADAQANAAIATAAAATATQQAADATQAAVDANQAALNVAVLRVDNQASLEAAVVPEAAKSIEVLGFYEAGDGGGYIARRTDADPGNLAVRSADRFKLSGGGADATNGGFFIKRIREELNIRALGARAVGTDLDNSDFINEAAEEAYKVIIPAAGNDVADSVGVSHSGQYYCTQPILTGRVGQVFQGPARARTNVDTGTEAVLYSAANPGAPEGIINVKHEACRIRGICFEGGSTSPAHNLRGILSLRDENTDDMDLTLEECSFFFLGEAINHYGRGMDLNGNLFSNCGTGFRQFWPTSNLVLGPDGPRLNPYARRGYRLRHNRFHHVADWFVVDHNASAPFRDAFIYDNFGDIGDTVFKGGGININMRNNGTFNTSDVGLSLTNIWQGCTVDGLYVIGDITETAVGGTGTPAAPQYGIVAACDVVDSDFLNIHIEHTERHGMYFQEKLVDAILAHIHMRDIGRDSSIGTDGCIKFGPSKDVTRVSMHSLNLRRATTGTRLISWDNNTITSVKQSQIIRDATLSNSGINNGATTPSGSDNSLQT